LIFPNKISALNWRQVIEERAIQTDSDLFKSNNNSNNNVSNVNNIDNDRNKNKNRNRKNSDDFSYGGYYHNKGKNIENNDIFMNNNDDDFINDVNDNKNNDNNNSNDSNMNNINKINSILNNNKKQDKQQETENKCFNQILVIPTAGLPLEKIENLKIEIARTMSMSVRK
jgi:hypothetical protein